MNVVIRLKPGFWRPASIVLAMVTVFPAAILGQDDDSEGRERRNWNPVEFLKRLDRDGDGQLNNDEMSGRSGRFISELGFDVSRPVAVDRVINKIDSDKKDEAARERRKGYEATRTIPGFGDEVIDLPDIPGFGLDADHGSSATSSETGRFDEETEQTIKEIMERYDENKDGLLAGDETRRVGRWVGSVEESDTDKDGKLSPAELGEGFKKQMQRRRSGEEAESANDDSRNRNGDRGLGGGRERSRPESTVSSESTPSRESTPSKSSASSSSTRSMDGRMTAYVDGVFQKYDKNSDNQLDKEELATVKVQFKDTDGDGIISRVEATQFVSGAQGSSGSVSPGDEAGQRPSRSRRGSSNSRDENADVEGTNNVPGDVVISGKTVYGRDARSSKANGIQKEGDSDKFVKLDANSDGQLQMNEFSKGKEWSDELYKEFSDADNNRDGVITRDEFDQ